MANPTIGDLVGIRNMMRTLLLIVHGDDVADVKVFAADAHKDDCVRVQVTIDGWKKSYRVPISLINSQDVRALAKLLAEQSEGAVLVPDMAIQMLERERQSVH